MIDYVLWEAMENGVEKVMHTTTAEEKAQKRLEVKARSTLMASKACESVGAFGRNSFTRRCKPEAIKKFVT
ncbi:hypothetical protein Tco_0106236 [Tanacetum coccineum]